MVIAPHFLEFMAGSVAFATPDQLHFLVVLPFYTLLHCSAKPVPSVDLSSFVEGYCECRNAIPHVHYFFILHIEKTRMIRLEHRFSIFAFFLHYLGVP